MPPAPPSRPRAVAVFCGSRTGHDPGALAASEALGRGLAVRGVELIYGGGRVGLMGAVADAVLAAGGQVIGVIPDFLTRLEVAHPGLTELHITDSMHSRKRMMFERADAFITMPGGFGTLDETVEIATWRQLGLHDKPIVLCNEGGWADALVAALRATVTQGFASDSALGLIEVVPDVAAVLARVDALEVQGPGRADRL